MSETITFRYADMAVAPKAEKQEDGTYVFRNIPFFEVHSRDGMVFDAEYMRGAVERQKELKAKGFLPRLTFGHTTDDIADPGPQVLAFADNYRFDEKDGVLYCDYVKVPQQVAEVIKKNGLPGRSAEAKVGTPEINVIALLSGKPGLQKLPDLRYSESEKIYRSSAMPKIKLKINRYAIAGDLRRYADQEMKPSPNDEADFQKFKSMLERTLAEWASEEGDETNEVQANAEGDPADPVDKDAKAASDETDPEKKIEKYSALPAAQNRAMWAQVTDSGEERKKDGKYPNKVMKGQWGYHADNSETLRYVETLEAKVNALTDENTRKDWVMRYAETALPKTRKAVEGFIDIIMALPEEKRAEAFKTMQAVSPSTSPLDRGQGVSTAKFADGETVDRDAKVFYEKNKAKYRGDTLRARRDYIATIA